MMIPGLIGTFSGGFRPTDIYYPLIWLDADQIVGQSDGDSIGTWTDVSGQGNHCTQAVAGKKPTYKVISGKPLLRFDGGDDLLGTLSITGNAITAIVVFSYLNTSANNCRILACSADDNLDFESTGAVVIGRDGTSEGIYSFRSAEKSNAGASYTQAHVATCMYDGTDNTIWVDGVRGTVVGSTGNFGITKYCLGDFPSEGGSSCLVGDMYEVIVYGSALSGESRMQLERYVAQKRGITIDQSPVNTVTPEITSPLGWSSGQTASCSTGTWTNSPTTFTYQWQKKPDADWLDIVGATSSTYVIGVGVVEIRCQVIASNAFTTGLVATSNDETIA